MATTPKTAKPAAAKAQAAKAIAGKADKPKAAAKPKAAPKAKAAVDPNAPKKVDALQKPLQPSPELAEIVGGPPISRGQVVSKVAEYIRAQKLQNPADKREILSDDKPKKLFGRERCTMLELNKYPERKTCQPVLSKQNSLDRSSAKRTLFALSRAARKLPPLK